MGSRGGGGYSTPPASTAALIDNIEKWSRRGWPLDAEGRFGRRASDAASEVITERPIETAKSFFEELGKGGRLETRVTKNGRVQMRVFEGGSRVNYREITTSSQKLGEVNPGVDIKIAVENPRYPRRYTIHFRKRRAGE